MTQPPSQCDQIGWRKFKAINDEAGENVINSLKDIFPDSERYIIEYSFDNIDARERLDLKSKEIAVLTAIGTDEPQLKVHLNGALNTGSRISKVKEMILQFSVYSGFSKYH